MKTANRIAWAVIGLVVLSAIAFAVYLLLPTAIGTDERDPLAEQGDIGTGDGMPPPIARWASATSTPAAGRPPRRLEQTGVVEQVGGSAFTIQTDIRGMRRVVLKADAQLIRVTTLTGPSAIRVGDAVIVVTEAITRDPFRPPEDTGRVRVIRVLQDGLSPEASPRCPPIGSRQGSVTAFEQGRLRLQTACGEQVFDVSPTMPVQRLSTAQAGDLEPGQRASVVGEELPDGSISGVFVQIIDDPQTP